MKISGENQEIFNKTELIFNGVYGNSADLLVSVVIPVFNQESILNENLNSIYCSMSLPFELIIINDASYDKSLNVIMTWVGKIKKDQKLLSRIRVYNNKKELFETNCDFFGFAVCEGKFILEIQSDIKITEQSFDRKMLSALVSFDDLFLISGRGTHSLEEVSQSYLNSMKIIQFYAMQFKQLSYWISNKIKILIKQFIRIFYIDFSRVEIISKTNSQSLNSGYSNTRQEVFPEIQIFERSKRAGLVGGSVQVQFENDCFSDLRIWLSETVMRGPIILDRIKYEAVGGLDNVGFFLGNDDHDLNFRAWLNKNWRTGYVPIRFESPLRDGSSRKEKSLKTMLRFLYLQNKSFRHRRLTGLFHYSKNTDIQLPKPEIRNFSPESLQPLL